jgi:hypothetical protein
MNMSRDAAPGASQTSAESTAVVPTARPARYGKQLVSHLTRHVRGEWAETENQGWLDFGGAQAELDADRAGALSIRLRAEPSQLSIYEEVLGSHLVRFGARDELVVAWQRDNGIPGSTQRRGAD